MGKLMLCCFLLPLALVSCRPVDKAKAAEKPEARARLAVPPDGFLEANISTSLGKFKRDVLIRDGQVDCVQWRDNLCVPFHGKPLDGARYAGALQNGEMAHIELAGND